VLQIQLKLILILRVRWRSGFIFTLQALYPCSNIVPHLTIGKVGARNFLDYLEEKQNLLPIPEFNPEPSSP
jgi:hypothetical protein